MKEQLRARWWRVALALGSPLVVACFSVSSVTLASEPVSREAWLLSLPEALSRGRVRAWPVVLAQHQLQVAESLRAGAGIIMPSNPRLAIDGRPPVTGGTIKDTGYAAMLEGLFEVGGAPRARVEEAQRNVDVSAVDLRVQEEDVSAAVYSAYIRAQLADLRVDEALQLVALGERILSAVTRRVSAGAGNDIEVSLAQADVAQWKASAIDAQRQRVSHYAYLRELLDVGPDQPFVLTTPVLSLPPPPPPAEQLVEQALSRRVEVEQLQARVSFLGATEERLNRELFPKTGFYVGVDAAPVSPVFGVVGLSVELPLAQRNQGALAAAGAQRRAEHEKLDLLRRRIAREVTALQASLTARREELEHLQREALPAVERTVQLTELGWLAGRFDLFRLTSSARDLARLRSLKLDALEAVWSEHVFLLRATGGAWP